MKAKALVFILMVFALCIFSGLVSGFPANKGTSNAAIQIGIPEILQPSQDEVISEPSIAVSGTAHAKSYILLYRNGQLVDETQTSDAGNVSDGGALRGSEGEFAFEDIELNDGENTLYVVSSIGRGRDGFKIQSAPVVVYFQPYGKRVVGPEGGSITSWDLQLRIDVPPEALPEKTLISVERIETTPGEIAYELQPTGLVFLKPVTATLTLSEEEQGWFGPKLIRVFLTEADGTIQSLACSVNEETGVISVEIEHFSQISFDAPLQFVDTIFDEYEHTWNDGPYVWYEKIKYFHNWDIAAGKGWWLWLVKGNLFKGVNLHLDRYSTYNYDNRYGGEKTFKKGGPGDWPMMTAPSASEWDIDIFFQCGWGFFKWTELFQCGSEGTVIGFLGPGIYYRYVRCSLLSGTLIWEYESKKKGRIELIGEKLNYQTGTPEKNILDTIDFGTDLTFGE